ncbi:29634_t:CDS:2, partial [Racocetra persica]
SSLAIYIKPKNALKFDLIHPPRSDRVNSSIINLKHVAMIASWVDRKPQGYSFDGQDKPILSRVRANHIDNAIYIYPSYGPQWGQNDLKTWGSFNADCCQCLRQRYEFPIRSSPDVFSAEEFE